MVVNFLKWLVTKLTGNVYIEVSLGEAMDKLSILQLKIMRLNEGRRLVNERDAIFDSILRYGVKEPFEDSLYLALYDVNDALWAVEEEIRKAEGTQFVQLAKMVIVLNTDRSKIKARINDEFKSNFVEVKNYDSQNQH